MGRLFGTDGVRGKAGEYPLDVPTVRRVGAALARALRHEDVSVRFLSGRDTRESGGWIEREWAVVVTPRFLTRLAAVGEHPLGRKVWGGTSLMLPAEAPEKWRNVFTGKSLSATAPGKKSLPLEQIFRNFPVALLSST